MSGHQSTLDERRLREENDALRSEVASLRRLLVDHPSANALRFIAPFIRDAIKADVWKPGPGTEFVEHELRAALAWLERFEATA